MPRRFFDLWWDADQEVYRRALDQLSALMQTYLNDNAYMENCRVELVRGRIKVRRSLLKKSLRENIAYNEIMLRLTDIVGLRIICNNNSDVYKAFKLIKGVTKNHQDLSIREESVEDYIKHPKKNGYRTLQFVLDYSVSYGNFKRKLPCEIQIRSVTQDAWAILSHADFYKREEDIPSNLNNIMKQLADQLETVNQIAEELRKTVEDNIETADITEDTLYMYMKKNYHYRPDSYTLKLQLDNLDDLGITTIKDLKDLLENPELREKVGQIIHDSGGPKPPPPDNDWRRWGGLTYTPHIGLLLFFGAICSKRGETIAAQEASDFFNEFATPYKDLVRDSDLLRRS